MMTKDWMYLLISMGFSVLAFIGHEKRLLILFIIGVFGTGYYFRRLWELVEEEII